MQALIGIDIGTSATKTVLFDRNGRTVASHSVEYPMYQPQNGWAEQEPDDWWNAACVSIRAVLQKSGIQATDIKGVGLSGQMHGLVLLDSQGLVLRPSIIWCDQRTAKECSELTNLLGESKLVEITANPALTGFTASKILWVKNHEPQIFSKCRHILLPKDYVRYRLTGDFATDVSDASGMQLLDVPRRRWSEEVLEKMGIDEGLLPRVYESPEITGTVNKQAAKLTGLAEGTPVVGGAGDNAAAAVGTGIVRDGLAFTTIGTSGVVYAHTSSLKVDPQGRVHTFCCAVPGCWHVMGVTQGAGLSLKWFRDNFCQEEKAVAGQMDLDVYDLMNREAEIVPPGSNGLVFLPYLMGERTPHLDPDCRGVFFGLSAVHTRRDMLRAVMEGVAYSMKDCMEVLSQLRIDIEKMTICGGGGRSVLWRQMLADLYRPIHTVLSDEGPALGAALLAGTGAGIWNNVQDASEAVVQMKDTQEPLTANTALYQPYYNLYKNLYFSLRERFKELSGILR